MFKKFIIDTHSDCCKDRENGDVFGFNSRRFCESTMERILIQLESNFYLVLVPNCLINNKYDTIIELVKKGIASKKVTGEEKYYYAQIHKSVTDKDLSDFRIRGIELKKWVTQVHYCYSNMANKEYYITSDMKFIEKWLGTWNEDLKASYEEAKTALKKETYLLNQLDYLYKCNIISDYFDEIEMFKTIDAFGKSIRKKAKENKQLINKL
jgi:hypothetical protein